MRQNDLNKYEKAREELKNTMNHIDITESGMRNLEGEDLKAFKSSLEIITETWKSARTDVLMIQGWLRAGQGLAVSLYLQTRKSAGTTGQTIWLTLVPLNKVHS